MRDACGAAKRCGAGGLRTALLHAGLLTCAAAAQQLEPAVEVTTPVGLQQAFQSGAAHIIVTDHLDLSQIKQPDSAAFLFTSDVSWSAATRTVRVRSRCLLAACMARCMRCKR